ncbi:O-antigen ligase [Haloprofundus sp. MHR1]|uniref:O-antigen ligase family protein n=1 Tax=Haloprofundus sp. MHR1 TaxID=2572921 RepID=UPI00143DB568|nr:O-antigen ligase family protein [Haloprofundus sp. MHR1]
MSDIDSYVVFLCLGLGVFAPVVGVLFESVVPYPALLAIVAVTVGYGALVVQRGTVVGGAVVALVITSTFALNVPLTSPYVPLFDEWYLRNVTGFFGPSLWAFQLPLLVLAAVGVKNGWYRRDRYKKSEFALGGVVVWAALSAVFGSPSHPMVAAFFTVYLLQVWLASVTVGRAIDDAYITAGDTVRLVVVAVTLHTAVAAAQFLNARSFGLSHLGGGAEPTTALLHVPGGLQVEMGLFVTGFTGMAYAYAALTVLVVPVVVALALTNEDRARKMGLTLLAVAMVFLNRATTSDAARGAMLVSLAAFAVLLLLANRQRVRETTHTMAEYVFFGVIMSAITLAPSDVTRQNNAPEEQGSNGSGNATGSPDLGMSEGTSVTPDGSAPAVQIPDWLYENPLFSVNSLEIRLKQYLASLDIIVREPLFGIGGVNFRYIASEYGISPPMGVHNIYLMIATGIGIPGLVFYIVAVLLVLQRILRTVFEEEADRVVQSGIFAGILGCLAFGLLDHVVLDRFTVILPFWILAASTVYVDR